MSEEPREVVAEGLDGDSCEDGVIENGFGIGRTFGSQ